MVGMFVVKIKYESNYTTCCWTLNVPSGTSRGVMTEKKPGFYA
jgi:hypothetical protein